MRCSGCGTKNREGRRFCAQCGQPLKVACGECGAANEPGEKFCGDCGAAFVNHAQPSEAHSSGKLPTKESERFTTAIDGERKTVTALFADIKGSTELMEELDPEEARAIVDPALKLMIEAVHRYDGYVVQSTGDGIFALFGAPIAHEDHPQRALYAALRMQHELHRLRARAAQGRAVPEARVGVNTGEVVVRIIETGGRVEYTPIGHTANLASRLQSLAPAGSVAIGDDTRKLVEGYFQLRGLGPTQVKGISEPVNLFEVRGVGQLRTRLQRAIGYGLTKFMGRERELAEMERALELACSGRGQLIAVVAEAGTGKSRLFYEFKATLPTKCKLLEAYSVSHGKASAWLPVLELMGRYFGLQDEDNAITRRQKVNAALAALDPALIDTLRYLLLLLGIQEDPDTLAQMDPQIKRRRTLEAIKRIIIRESLNQPMVAIFEDLHWIDNETQAFLDFLTESIANTRVLLLVNYRPEYSHRWNNKTYYTQLRLDPLNREDADRMLTTLVGDGTEVRPVKRLILESTQGNPFFMEETVQMLLAEGALARSGTTVKFTKVTGNLKIPPTVQAILAARIDQLPPEEKRLLQTLAVIGKEFSLGLVHATADTSAEELGRMLDDLQLGEFIYEQPAVGDIEYTFKHSLTHEVAYKSLLLQQRKELHRAVAGTIEELYPGRLAEHYAELARHFISAEDWPKAVQYSTLAGDQVAQSYSNVEGEQHYARALAAALRLPMVEPGTLADLYTRRAGVLSIVGQHDDAVLHYQRAQEIARAAGDRSREGQILFGLSMVYWNAHQKDQMLEYSGQALTLARETGDKVLEASCAIWTANVGNSLGPNVASRKDAEQALSLAETTGSPVLSVLAHSTLGRLLQWQADFDRSVPHLRQSIELAGQSHLGQQYGLCIVQLGSACLSKGEYDEALRWYRRCADYADGAGDRMIMACSANLPGGVHLELYDFGEALKNSLESYETACRLSPWTEARAHALTKAGLSYFELGDFALADKFFLRAWELLESKDDFVRWRWHMVLLRGRGELALARGRRDEAWKFTTQSLDLASKTVSRKHVARAQWLQGEILAAEGRLDESARTLDASARQAERIGTPREIWIARSALGRVLGQLGRDNEAEAQFVKAADAIEGVSSKLKTRALSRSLLSAETVRAVYKALGRQPPLLA
jgi:class 3 adenylate cyclase/tetratricopeptide (TPR) repeat protein